MAEQLIEQGREQGREQGLEQGREQGLEQGREQGLEQGREQGVRDTLTKQLVLKFNAVSAEHEAQIQAATLEQLERYAARILTAETIDAVFVMPG